MSDTVLGQTDVRRILGNVSEGRRGVKSSHIPSSMKNMTCIEDLRLAARRRVPRAFFGYAEAGSYSEVTLDRIHPIEDQANRTEPIGLFAASR